MGERQSLQLSTHSLCQTKEGQGAFSLLILPLESAERVNGMREVQKPHGLVFKELLGLWQ